MPGASSMSHNNPPAKAALAIGHDKPCDGFARLWNNPATPKRLARDLAKRSGRLAQVLTFQL